MTRLPSFAEAHALMLFLHRLADEEASTAKVLRQFPAADATRCERRAVGLKRAADLVEWMAGRSDRLRELERPYSGGRK
jgi:hypothetical protein